MTDNYDPPRQLRKVRASDALDNAAQKWAAGRISTEACNEARSTAKTDLKNASKPHRVWDDEKPPRGLGPRLKELSK